MRTKNYGAPLCCSFSLAHKRMYASNSPFTSAADSATSSSSKSPVVHPTEMQVPKEGTTAFTCDFTEFKDFLTDLRKPNGISCCVILLHVGL